MLYSFASFYIQNIVPAKRGTEGGRVAREEGQHFCSSMAINHIIRTQSRSCTQDPMEHVRQSGLVLSLCNCVASPAKSHHGLTVADLGLFRRPPQQNSGGLLQLNQPHTKWSPEDCNTAKHYKYHWKKHKMEEDKHKLFKKIMEYSLL